MCSQYYSLAYRVALVSGRKLKDHFTRWYCVVPCLLVFFGACLAVGGADLSTVADDLKVITDGTIQGWLGVSGP